MLLLVSGDVELNPGPLTKDELALLKSLQDGQAEIINELKSIDASCSKHEAMIKEINEKLGKTTQEIEGLNKSASEQTNAITSLTQRVKDLQSRNNRLENRSRQQNLVFYGVDDNNRAET